MPQNPNTFGECEYCGIRYRIKPGSHGRFCSYDCSREAVRRKPRSCAWCGGLVNSPDPKVRHCSYECSVQARITTPETRFWDKVNKTDSCWLWTGSKRTGYGRIWSTERRTKIAAHRLSWEMHYGPIPEGMSVLHRCDTPACVRPDHLFLGTLTDNNRDRAMKGRSSRGSDRPGAKLTANDVRSIRKLASKGVMYKDIALRHGVSTTHISAIVTRKKWKHVE